MYLKLVKVKRIIFFKLCHFIWLLVNRQTGNAMKAGQPLLHLREAAGGKPKLALCANIIGQDPVLSVRQVLAE